MYKFSKTVTIISILVFAISISLILITVGLTFDTNKKNAEPWILQSYGNNVALYNDGQVIEVYGEIMLDTLPDEDKRMLDNGISFLTKNEAVMAVEDYDG